MDGELKHSIAVVADGPTCTGFRLAGVQMVFPIEALEAQKDATQGKAAENKSAGGGQIAAEQKIEELYKMLKIFERFYDENKDLFAEKLKDKVSNS